MTIYLVGHGTWNVIQSQTPWAKVPRDTTITFYTEHAKLLMTSATTEIADLSEADLLGESNGSKKQYESCPNYTLSTFDDWTKQWFNAVIPGCVQVAADTPLCTGVGEHGPCIEDDDPYHTCQGLFATNHSDDIVWLACRHVSLRPEGGDAFGLNTQQAEIGADPDTSFSDWEKSVWGSFNDSPPDDFYAWFQTCTTDEKIRILSWSAVAERFAQEGRDLT